MNINSFPDSPVVYGHLWILSFETAPVSLGICQSDVLLEVKAGGQCQNHRDVRGDSCLPTELRNQRPGFWPRATSTSAQPTSLSSKEKHVQMPSKFSICFSSAPAASEKHSEVSIGLGRDGDGVFSTSPEAYTPLGELHLHAHRMPSDCFGLHLWADPMGSPHACQWSFLSLSLAPKRQRASFSWNLLPRQSQTRHHNKEFFCFPCLCVCQEDAT